MEDRCRRNSPVSRFSDECEFKPFRGGVDDRVQDEPGRASTIVSAFDAWEPFAHAAIPSVKNPNP